MTEDIGRHKGAVETLLHEKKELSRLLQIVNSQLEKHMAALEDAGVDTEQFIQEVRDQGQKKQQQRKQQQRQQQDQGRQQRSNRQQGGANRGRQNSGRQQSGSSGNQESEDEDADDLLEGEDDFSDRDFSPR